VTPDPEPRPHPAAEPANAVRQEIYRCRGQIVSDVADLENTVSWVLEVYFLKLAGNLQFRTWVLGRITLADKIVILEEAAEALGIKDKVSATFPRLRRANDIRNEQAHSTVDYNLEAIVEGKIDWDRFFQWRSQRVSRRRVTSELIDVKRLERQCEFTKYLPFEVLRILAALMAIRANEDPLAAIDKIDAGNPQHAPAMSVPAP